MLNGRLGGLLFNFGLDFDFDLPSDGEVKESFGTNESPEPSTRAEAPSRSSSSET